jgi:hypothetical protein
MFLRVAMVSALPRPLDSCHSRCPLVAAREDAVHAAVRLDLLAQGADVVVLRGSSGDVLSRTQP